MYTALAPQDYGSGISLSNKLPWWLSGKVSACQCKRLEFNSWVEKIPQEKEMASHSSILAWKIPWTEELVGDTIHGVARESDTI